MRIVGSIDEFFFHHPTFDLTCWLPRQHFSQFIVRFFFRKRNTYFNSWKLFHDYFLLKKKSQIPIFFWKQLLPTNLSKIISYLIFDIFLRDNFCLSLELFPPIFFGVNNEKLFPDEFIALTSNTCCLVTSIW